MKWKYDHILELPQRDSEYWPLLRQELVKYSEKRLARIRWRNSNTMPPIEGVEPEDIAHDAITQTLSKSRTWIPEKEPLLKFLVGVASSIISNLATSSDNQTSELPIGNKLIDHKSEIEKRIEFIDELSTLFREISKKDIKLGEIFDYFFFRDIKSTKQLSEIFGVSQKTIIKRKKKMKKMIEEIAMDEHL